MSLLSRPVRISSAAFLAVAVAVPAQAAQAAPAPAPISFAVTDCMRVTMTVRQVPQGHTYVLEANRWPTQQVVGPTTGQYLVEPGLHAWRVWDATTRTYAGHGSFRVPSCQGVRTTPVTTHGDEDGDGRADIMAVHQDGRLMSYRWNGRGLDAGRVTGGGWGAMRFAARTVGIGSSLTAVRADGTVWGYRSRLNGLYDRPVRLGGGLDAYTDYNVLSRFDTARPYEQVLTARKGRTEFQWGLPVTGLTWPEQVTAVMDRRVLHLEDVTGDGWGDDVEISPDGTLTLVTRSWNDTRTRRVVGHGWSAMTLVAGPGDVTGDGLDDLVARRSDGRLYLYPGSTKAVNGAPGFLAGRQIGSGWNGMRLIF